MQLFTLDEVGQQLKMTHWGVRRWIKQGRLKGVRMGRRLLVRDRDLRKFITQEVAKRNTADSHTQKGR